MFEKLNSFMKEIGGYKGLAFINVAILVLVLALMFVQQGWIKKEKTAIETAIETKKKELKESEQADSSKDAKI